MLLLTLSYTLHMPSCLPTPAGFNRPLMRATRRVLTGVCTESLALKVALAQRMPARVVQRAAAFLMHMRTYKDLGSAVV